MTKKKVKSLAKEPPKETEVEGASEPTEDEAAAPKPQPKAKAEPKKKKEKRPSVPTGPAAGPPGSWHG